MSVDEANAKFTQEQKKAHQVSVAKDIIAAGEMRALSKADKRGMLGRDFRLEYNEKHLLDEDFEMYTLLRKGEQPDETYMRALEAKHPSLDFGLMSEPAIREMALNDLDDLANRIGQRAGDRWDPEFKAGLEQLSDLAALSLIHI